MISANGKSPCPWCCPSGAAQRKKENSGSARWKTATRRTMTWSMRKNSWCGTGPLMTPSKGPTTTATLRGMPLPYSRTARGNQRCLRRWISASSGRFKAASLPLPTSRDVFRQWNPAAICAVSRLSNNPKQVAPEPDMREQTMSGWKFRLPITSAISGTSCTAGTVRSLRQLWISWRLTIPAPKVWPAFQVQGFKHRGGGCWNSWIDQHDAPRKIDLNRLNNFPDATHAAGFLNQAYGHIGAELKRQFAQILR